MSALVVVLASVGCGGTPKPGVVAGIAQAVGGPEGATPVLLPQEPICLKDLSDPARADPYRVDTDSTANYRLSVPPGHYAVSACGGLCYSGTVTVTSGSTVVKDVGCSRV